MKLAKYAVLMLLIAAGIGATASAKDRDRDARALVLGDSVAFAYIASAGHEYINPENFFGFSNYLDEELDLDVADAGCPGETTGSLLSATAPDNGCRAYRAAFPLHVTYASTQGQFATHFLQEHHDVRLVTITLGANDGFLLEDSCATQPDPTACITAGLPTLLATVEGNLSKLLNGAIAAPAAAYGAVVADVFTAFKTVATNPLFGGKTCNAGLLNASSANQLLCDVHPAQSGHRLIAKTIARAYRAHHW
jgi:hypothetical protein